MASRGEPERAPRWPSTRSRNVDFRVHREADAQRVTGKLLRVEGDAHRQALDDLDPVAGRVLRRDQSERRPGAASKAGDSAVIDDAASVKIRRQFQRLTRANALELAFLEIGV